MILGKVVGTVWGGKEATALAGSKLLQVQPVKFPANSSLRGFSVDDDADICLGAGLVVALDSLGAGVGEYVLVAHGSRVRDLTVGASLPTKDVVIAIVDGCELACADSGEPS